MGLCSCQSKTQPFFILLFSGLITWGCEAKCHTVKTNPVALWRPNSCISTTEIFYHGKISGSFYPSWISMISIVLSPYLWKYVIICHNSIKSKEMLWMNKHIWSLYLPTVMVVFRNGEYHQISRKLQRRIFMALNFQWAKTIRRSSLCICTFHVKSAKKKKELQVKITALSLCLGETPSSTNTLHLQAVRLFLWQSWPSGKRLAHRSGLHTETETVPFVFSSGRTVQWTNGEFTFFFVCISYMKHVSAGLG